MEEKTTQTQKEKNSLTYTAAIFIGMILICAVSLYIPSMIYALLFLTPIALKHDMEDEKPLFSSGLTALIILFVFLSDVEYSLYIILALSTGFCVLINYFVKVFMKVEKFSEGVMYSAAFSVIAALMAATIIFILRDRQSFAAEIVSGLETWILNNDSYFINTAVDAFYNNIHISNSEQTQDVGVLMNIITGAVDYGSDLTKAQKMDAIMPYLQNTVNVYAIFMMMVYPAFAGVITWWRGNYRFYKGQPMQKEGKSLKPKPFSTFTIPRRMFLVVILLLVLSFLLRMSGNSDVMLYAGNAIQSFVTLLLAIQGVAVMEYFLKRSPALRNGALRIVIIILISIVSFGFIPMFLGATDLLINIRMVYIHTKELRKKMYQEQARQAKKNKEKDDEENKK